MSTTAIPSALPFKSDIVDVLQNRQWFSSRDPFHHFHVRDVFRPYVYASLERHFRAILSRGLFNTASQPGFVRMQGYDAYAYSFTRDMQGPLALFISRQWHDLIATAYRLRATGDVRAGLHHHLIASAAGGIHNDFNPGWFVGDAPAPGRINLSDPSLCSYQSGESTAECMSPRCTVRAVAVLFYLCNPNWRPGDGGETALFRAYTRSCENPALTVPPVNNSMLVFECTPDSWHTFLSNCREPRNSVVMWLHRHYEEAVERWGEHRIIKWQ